MGEEIQSAPLQDSTIALSSAPYSVFGQDFSPLPSMLVDVGVMGSTSCRSYALTNEAFSPVLAVATAEAVSAKDFPIAAARAVNQHVFGTLSCNVMFPDGPGAELDALVHELNYGCVSVNMWAALSYSNPLGVWGGAPGSYTKEKPESGVEFVGNVAGIPNVAKSVCTSPFLNDKISASKPIPMIVLDCLNVLVSGQKHAAPKIAGILFGRGFGLLPRKMPRPSDADQNAGSRRGLQCFERRSNTV